MIVGLVTDACADEPDSRILAVLEALDGFIRDYEQDSTLNMAKKLAIFHKGLGNEILYHRDPFFATRFRDSIRWYDEVARHYNPQHHTTDFPAPPMGQISGPSSAQITDNEKDREEQFKTEELYPVYRDRTTGGYSSPTSQTWQTRSWHHDHGNSRG
jgi:hypothetical protein